MSSPISAEFGAIESLAADLAALGAELVGDAEVCTSCAVSLGTALDGLPGEAAADVGRAWALLVGQLGERAAAVSHMLEAAVGAYRALDGELAERVVHRCGPTTRGTR